MKTLWTAAFVAALLLAPRAAFAFGADGEYVRDDGKTYLFYGNRAIQTSPGEWGCRIDAERRGGEMTFRCTFTRTKDEGGLFRTTGKSVGEFWKDTAKVKLEWVELDDAGKVKERGEEEHTFKLKRKLTREENAVLGDVLLFHALADDLLDPESRMYDPAGALDKLLEGNARHKHPSLEARIAALKAAKTGPSKAEKLQSWFASKQAELAAFEKAADWAGLEKLGREAMRGPPDLNFSDGHCLELGAEAFSKALALAPENDAIAFEAVAALYWTGSHEQARDVLTKLERRNGAAKDAHGREVSEWVRRFEAAVAHDRRFGEARREAEELRKAGFEKKAAAVNAEADAERDAKDREAELFVRYFVDGTN